MWSRRISSARILPHLSSYNVAMFPPQTLAYTTEHSGDVLTYRVTNRVIDVLTELQDTPKHRNDQRLCQQHGQE